MTYLHLNSYKTPAQVLKFFLLAAGAARRWLTKRNPLNGKNCSKIVILQRHREMSRNWRKMAGVQDQMQPFRSK